MTRERLGLAGVLTLGLMLGFGAGCGEVLNDAGDAGPDQCLPSETLCSESCTDTQTAHTNCGECGTQCANDEVCNVGSCTAECSVGLDICDGGCVDLQTDSSYCGDCNIACTSAQTCEAGICEELEDLSTLEFSSTWPDTSGWTDSAGAPITMGFADHGLPGAVFECRTGPDMMIGAMSWSFCDGVDGTTAMHRPLPVTGTEEGSYRTEVRLKLGAWTSTPISHFFYAHHSLDATIACDSGFTDAQIFAMATTELGAAVDPFDSTAVVRRPFVHIPFRNVPVGHSLTAGGPTWRNPAINPNPDTDPYFNRRPYVMDAYDVDLMSLRRRFTFSPDRRLLMINRAFESRGWRTEFDTTNPGLASSCRNNFRFGRGYKANCPLFVLNSRGKGVCLGPASGDATQLINTRSLRSLPPTFDEGWVKLLRRGGTRTFSNKYRDACPNNNCLGYFAIALPE